MPISTRDKIWFKFYTLDFTQFQFFLSTFIETYQEFELLSITYVIVLYWEKVSKIFKNCSLRTLCRQKQDQHSLHLKSNSIFSLEMRIGYRFSRTFHLIKIYVLTKLWIVFYLVLFLLPEIAIFESFKCKFLAFLPVWLFSRLDS